jgi:anti-sigma-K factor RskA
VVIGVAAPKATLAVSLEPPGGSKTGAPTGPVIAAGPLTAPDEGAAG